jgi:predicted nucleotidyltransferase
VQVRYYSTSRTSTTYGLLLPNAATDKRPGKGRWIVPKLGAILPKLGMTTSRNLEAMSISNALFSKVQQRVLALIFGHPERSFYTSEIVRQVRSGTGAVERELSRLEHSGLVSVERIGNQKHFRANPDSPVFAELQRLVVKTIGLAEPLRKALQPYSNQIKASFVYGSVAKGSDTARSDIDLMVIGDDLSYSDLYGALQNAEGLLQRKVSPLFLSVKDWKRKASQKDSFANKIKAQPKLFVFGSEADIEP